MNAPTPSVEPRTAGALGPVDDATLLGILDEVYGLAAEPPLRREGSELGVVCRVETGRGPLALKLSLATGVERALTRWQGEVQALLHAAGIPVSDLLRARDGSLTADVTIDGVAVSAQLSTWLSGVALSDTPSSVAVREAVGDMAARVADALDDAPAPPVARAHTWELVRSSISIRDALPAVADRRLRTLCERVADRFDVEVAPHLGSLHVQVVHHDLHDSNLLFALEDAEAPRVVGVLDLGDMVTGPRIADLVVSAAYAARPTLDPVASVLDVAAGWSRVLPLTDIEREVLFPGVIARLAVNGAVWASRATGDRAAYAAMRSAASVDALERLVPVPTAEVIGRMAARGL